MPLPTDCMFEGERVLLLKAIDESDLLTVERMLRANPSLINIKTDEKKWSLLHIAARKNLYTICQCLLDNGHVTNPIDKDDKTPYQYTNNPDLMRLLANHHMQFLYRQEFTATSKAAEITKIRINVKPSKILDPNSFQTLIPSNTVALAFIQPASFQTGIFELTPYFREDIIMKPYYGELLVCHENENACQYMELWCAFAQKKMSTNEQIQSINYLLPRIEARAFIKFIHKGLSQFEFLRHFPKPENVVGLQEEVYKMFIVFGALPLLDYVNQCIQIADKDPSLLEHLQSLAEFQEVMKFCETVVPPGGNRELLPLIKEIHQKYIPSSPAGCEPPPGWYTDEEGRTKIPPKP